MGDSVWQVAYDRQMRRYGADSQMCSLCGLPCGRHDRCYPCLRMPWRTLGVCQSCGRRIGMEYLICHACNKENPL